METVVGRRSGRPGCENGERASSLEFSCSKGKGVVAKTTQYTLDQSCPTWKPLALYSHQVLQMSLVRIKTHCHCKIHAGFRGVGANIYICMFIYINIYLYIFKYFIKNLCVDSFHRFYFVLFFDCLIKRLLENVELHMYLVLMAVTLCSIFIG